MKDHRTEQAEADFQLRVDILKKLRIVIRAAQRHSLWVERRCGVPGAQLWMMQELFERPGLRVGELASKLAIHQTTASNLLDNLKRRGFVEKARDAQDLRVIHLALTDSGKNALARAPTPARGLMPEAILKLDARSLRHLERGLQGLFDSMNELDEGFGMLPMPFTM